MLAVNAARTCLAIEEFEFGGLYLESVVTDVSSADSTFVFLVTHAAQGSPYARSLSWIFRVPKLTFAAPELPSLNRARAHQYAPSWRRSISSVALWKGASNP